MALTALREQYVHPVPWLEKAGAAPRKAVVTSGFRTESRPGHDGSDLLFQLLAIDGPQREPNTDGGGRWWHPSGMSALSIADGVVLTSNVTSTGGHIHVLHAGGVSSQYIHLAQRLVKQGDRVRKGQPIGVIGAGSSHLVHLHFQLRLGTTLENKEGQLVDPAPYLATMRVISDPRKNVLVKYLIGGLLAYGLYKWWKGRR